MGAEFWDYLAPFRGDVATSLEDLRQEEFAAGRFHLEYLRPPTIQQAFTNAGADGTRSILDMECVAPSPMTGVVCPLPRPVLLAIFGTDRPTFEMLEEVYQAEDLPAWEEAIEEIRQGEGRYILIYEEGEPAWVHFFGCSHY